MLTTTGPVGIVTVRPASVSLARTPRSVAADDGAAPPGRKLLSGFVTIRSGGVQVPWPPCRQLPYWTLKAPLGSGPASAICIPWKEPPAQYTGNGAMII